MSLSLFVTAPPRKSVIGFLRAFGACFCLDLKAELSVLPVDADGARQGLSLGLSCVRSVGTRQRSDELSEQPAAQACSSSLSSAQTLDSSVTTSVTRGHTLSRGVHSFHAILPFVYKILYL